MTRTTTPRAASTTPPVAAPASPAVASKPHAKPKLVRDSFTIPKNEYAVLDALKLRAANLKRPTKKSELLRAGIGALDRMTAKAFLDALKSVPSLKTGRPKSPDAAPETPGAVVPAAPAKASKKAASPVAPKASSPAKPATTAPSTASTASTTSTKKRPARS